MYSMYVFELFRETHNEHQTHEREEGGVVFVRCNAPAGYKIAYTILRTECIPGTYLVHNNLNIIFYQVLIIYRQRDAQFITS